MSHKSNNNEKGGGGGGGGGRMERGHIYPTGDKVRVGGSAGWRVGGSAGWRVGRGKVR